ncbi:MAG: type IV pilin protein [Gammaproteobacteria bacterium]|nr:type IV pilin protein [Gammaproteobacteria bacterium]
MRGQSGFTLIELMIVVVVVGILAAIAYPSYRQYGVRTNRAAATADLAMLSQWMEREFTATGAYDDSPNENDGDLRVALPFASSPQEDPTPAYNLSVDNLTATTFRVVATPIGSQADHDAGCAVLSLDNAGVKCIQDGASCSNVADERAAVDACW